MYDLPENLSDQSAYTNLEHFSFETEQCVASRFEQQVETHADRLAVQGKQHSLSYKELNRLANAIAHQIQFHIPVGNNCRVAIYLEKDVQYIAAIIAVLKAGHAYVPVDPSFPDSRNQYIIENSDSALVICNHRNSESLRQYSLSNIPVLNLDSIELTAVDTNLDLEISPDDLSYLIYTSGSTGRPKGVMQNQRNLLHGCKRRTDLQKISPDDRMSLFYSCSVMGSVYCIFGALLNGASLHCYDIREEGLVDLESWLVSRKLTIYHSVASVFREFAKSFRGGSAGFSVRLVIFGGERVLTSDVELARRVFGRNVMFFTGLGSTETGTIRHYPIYPDTEIDGKVVPIGYPVEDVEIQLLNESGQQVPGGEVGEIVVKSKYVALGYWKDDKNTAKSFSKDKSDPDVRLYRTGDMGLLAADGLLTHQGRKDFQVKIRGFRIEVGEVEAALVSLGGVGESVVVAREINGEQRLVAYIVLDTEAQSICVRTLREHLKHRLPYYMLPAVFVRLLALPRTPNNKVDRNSLPLPAPDNELEDEIAVPAESETEAALVEICGELLDREKIGINRTFFEHGGDSLSATQLLSRVQKRFHVKVSMAQLFEAEDLKSLALLIENSDVASENTETIPPQVEGKVPASFAQKRMWLVDKLNGGMGAYNISNCVKLKGELNIEALRYALQLIISRHDILRTRFPSDENGPWQEIDEAGEVCLELVSLVDLSEAEQESRLKEFTAAQLNQAHDLAQGPLFTYKLIKIKNDEYCLSLVFNHIVYDNIWSSGIFFNELGKIYDATIRGEKQALPELSIQFSDYARWEQNKALDGSMLEHVSYWREQLAEPPEALQLPFDRRRPDRPSFKGGQVSFVVPGSVSTSLSFLAKEESATPFMVLLAAWKLLLHRYTDQLDIVVGTPTGRRYRTDTENLIGLFINNLVLRTDFSYKPSLRELIARVKKTTIEAFSHDELPFEKLVEALNPSRTAGMSPYFQHMFIHRKASKTPWSLPGLALEKYDVEHQGSKFDLTLSVLENEGEVTGTLEFSSDLFDATTAERIVSNYVQLLTSICDLPDVYVGELNIVAPQEKAALVEQWNQSQSSYPVSQTVHQIFEQWVSKQPEKIAVISDDRTLSYAQLNSEANKLAACLLHKGVQEDDLIAVCLHRSADLVVALLAVFKAGAAYVPLDPYFPADRLQYMIADSEAKIFVSEERVLAQLGSIAADTIVLDREKQALDGYEEKIIGRDFSSNSLAYVIYTSGSTGKPKGVAITQRNLVNFLYSMQREPGLGEGDTLLSLTTICFDIAALELFLPLVSGASLIIKSREASLSPSSIIETIDSSKASVVQATPVTWRMLTDNVWREKKPVKVLCGGEAMGVDLAEKLLGLASEVWNVYGPTETTIWSSIKRVRQKEDSEVIGKPIANTQFYVVNDCLQLQPLGVPGELLIGGDGLARGYFNRDEITREKFINHPLAKNERLYRTGDMVTRKPDGEIVFLGRMDNQVKIRGFRIELGDIETHVSELESVKQAVVIAREDTPGDKRLIAYISPRHSDIDINALRNHLRAKLPEYMVPSAFVQLQSFPQTPNGKVDRKKLPEPPRSETRKPVLSKEPLGETEFSAVLRGIFEEVLQIDVTSSEASFFDLGGHSLSALTVVARINQRFSINLPETAVFEHQSITELSNVISRLLAGESHEDIAQRQLSPEELQKIDSIVALLKNVTREGVGENAPEMQVSWLCKHIFARLYPRKRRFFRGLIEAIILRLEGGSTFTTTLRKIYKEVYDIDVGDFTSLGFNAKRLRNHTRIGRYCSIVRTTVIQNADHPRNTVATHAVFYHPKFGFTNGYELDRVKVEIGNDVWIGDGCKILYPTKKIGDGAVIASNSVVVDDVPPYAIVGGYPARVIRYRFSKETIDKLQETKWWKYSLKELQAIRNEFMKPLEGDKIR